MATKIETRSLHACFGGEQGFYTHVSSATGTRMNFAVFMPPQAASGPVPALWCLAGLTCTDETFPIKAGAQALAADLGVMLVTPDTSPRGHGIPDDEAYDLGQGAGFYLDATEAPWSSNFRMASYVAEELPETIAANFALDLTRQGIMGHSMGGHGALTLGLTRPGQYQSVSAFAPIVAPSRVPWGRKAFTAYLGPDEARWRAHDACALIAEGHRVPELLVDQGEADKFLTEQLRPELLEDSCRAAGIPLTLRRQRGYDHSYWFIQSFAADHLRWHAERLHR